MASLSPLQKMKLESFGTDYVLGCFRRIHTHKEVIRASVYQMVVTVCAAELPSFNERYPKARLKGPICASNPDNDGNFHFLSQDSDATPPFVYKTTPTGYFNGNVHWLLRWPKI